MVAHDDEKQTSTYIGHNTWEKWTSSYTGHNTWVWIRDNDGLDNEDNGTIDWTSQKNERTQGRTWHKSRNVEDEKPKRGDSVEEDIEKTYDM